MSEIRYGMCSKCGAVSKNGKCSKCGRISLQSSNSAMDELRREKGQWNRQNEESHQDHCNDYGSGANVYLNGKVIRRGGTNVWADENKRFQYTQEDIASYSDNYDGDYEPFEEESYSEPLVTSGNTNFAGQINSQTSVFASPQYNPPQTPNTPNTPTKASRPKRKRGALAVWIFVLVFLAELSSCKEDMKNSEDFASFSNLINKIVDEVKGNDSYNIDIITSSGLGTEDVSVSGQPKEDISVSELPLTDNSGVYAYVMSLRDPIMLAYENESTESYIADAVNPFADGQETSYYLTDYIDTSVDYSIMWKSVFFISPSDDSDAPVVEYSSIYPQIINSNLKYEKKINELIIKEASNLMYDYKTYPEGAKTYTLYSNAYVTYMDDYTLSIYLDEGLMYDDSHDDRKFGRCLVIDLQNGQVISANDYFNIGERFTQAYNDMLKNVHGEDCPYVSEEDLLFAMDKGTFQWLRTPIGFILGIYDTNYNMSDLYEVADIKPFIQ